MATRPKHTRTPKPPVKDKRPDQRIKPGTRKTTRQDIGTVVAAWSGLEACLQAAIWAFLKLSEDDGRLVAARMDARPKIEWLGVLGERYLPEGDYAKRFFEASARISELADDRNFIVHGVWSTLKPENQPIAASLRKNTPPGKVLAETFPADRFKAILNDITVALEVMKDVPTQLAASRGK